MVTQPEPRRKSALEQIARRAMQTYGFEPDFSADAMKELASVRQVDGVAASAWIDLRHLLWVFIDNNDSLDLETLEARPVIDGDEIQDLQADARNRAKEIIEDFMIAANGVIARFLHGKKVASLRRMVRSPKCWDRIVEAPDETAPGHFGPAVKGTVVRIFQPPIEGPLQ
jgi:hypothetical protein